MTRALLLAGALALASCRGRPPAPDVAAADRLRASVDDLGARVARLDPDAYARPVGAGCAEACGMWGTQRLTFKPGGAECVCRRTPRLGTTPKITRAASVKRSVRPSGPAIAAAEAPTP